MENFGNVSIRYTFDWTELMTSNGVIIQSYFNDKQKLFKHNSKSSLLPIGPTGSPVFPRGTSCVRFRSFRVRSNKGEIGPEKVKRGQIRVEKGQNLPWPILVVDDLVIVLLFRPLYRILMPEKNHKFHENFI